MYFVDELAYKDAVKKVSLYDSAIVLLMGLYYFYKNSPKQRSNLNLSFEALGDKKVLPTWVGGTIWVGHVVLAVETFFKAYNAIVTHLGDVVQQKKSQVLIHLDLLFSTLTLKMLHKLQANELK